MARAGCTNCRNDMRSMYFDAATRSIADVSLDPEDGAYVVNRINVPSRWRGLGIARRLLREITDDADREHVTLKLVINAYGDMSHAELAEWYQRNGFELWLDGWYRRAPKYILPEWR